MHIDFQNLDAPFFALITGPKFCLLRHQLPNSLLEIPALGPEPVVDRQVSIIFFPVLLCIFLAQLQNYAFKCGSDLLVLEYSIHKILFLLLENGHLLSNRHDEYPQISPRPQEAC